MDSKTKKELTNKEIFAFGIIILMAIIIPFLLYISRVISKGVMAIIDIVPVIALVIMVIVLKKNNRM